MGIERPDGNGRMRWKGHDVMESAAEGMAQDSDALDMDEVS